MQRINPSIKYPLKQNQISYSSIEIQKQLKQYVQKAQYFKLVSQLQEQKRTITEQQAHLLREYIQQLKKQNQDLRKKIDKVSNKYNKLKQKQRERIEQSKIKNSLANTNEKNIYIDEVKNQGDLKCSYCDLLEGELNEQRQLYVKDRTIFKSQILKLKQEILQYRQLNQHHTDLTDNLDSQINFAAQLKRQLAMCYNKMQDQYQIIEIMHQKIGHFQIQYQKLLDLVKILQNKIQLNPKHFWKQAQQKLNQNKQQRYTVSNNIEKSRPINCSTIQNFQYKHPNEAVISFEGKSNGKDRRCGSIKQLQVKKNNYQDFRCFR